MRGHRELSFPQQEYPSMFKLTLGAEHPPSVKEMDRLLHLVRRKRVLQEQGTTYDSSEARNLNESKKPLQELKISENDPMRIIDNPFTGQESRCERLIPAGQLARFFSIGTIPTPDYLRSDS